MPSDYLTFKVMLLGEPASGKADFVKRYTSAFFSEDTKLTIGIDFYSKITYFRGKKYKIQIWDFGGERRFRFLLHQYCKGANGALIMYDITNSKTLENLSDWVQIIRNHSGDIPIILVGNKLDLEESREVFREIGIEIAKKYNLSGFIEVYSKTGQNVEETFEALTELVVDYSEDSC